MTTCYQWFSFPDEFSVCCPKCKLEARCKNAPIVRSKQVGGATHYEAVGEPGVFEGDVSCLNCGFTGRVEVHWYQDAYWKCDVKGKTLWAWSLEHAKVLLDYIKSSERDEKAYPGYLSSLLHLPTHFKLTKNREASVKSLSQLIDKK